METAVLSTVLTMLGPKLYAFLQDNHDLRRNLEHDIQYIRNELRMIAAAIDEHDHRQQRSHNGAVQGAWIHGARELAYAMEDCVDRFLHRVTTGGHGRLATVAVRTRFAAMIQKLRKKSEDLSRLRSSYADTGGCDANGESSNSSGIFLASEAHAPAGDTVPVGMDGPRDEILALVRETQGQPKRLKVISLVGFGGLGKTLLAMKVYESDAVREGFHPRVWVSAAGKSAANVLRDMLCQLGLGHEEDDYSDVNKIITILKTSLHSKRFFIVIDDMQREYWNSTIKDAFPLDTGLTSIVLVTTTVHSIANACSSGNGHVYVMSTLDKKHSRQLFLRETSWDEYPPGSEAAVCTKCDGLPLALVSTAQFLQSKGQQIPQEYAKLCDNLGMHMEREDTLARMKHVLVHNYTSLPGHVIKACLLYFGVFPSGHQIGRGKLIRRWSAEGIVEADPFRRSLDVATDYFKELINRSIIQPVAVSSNTEVKTCQTHGMMLEFILRKSRCDDFITLLCDQVHLPDKIRCLSVQQNNSRRGRGSLNSNIDLSLVRSLTIFGEAEESVLEFSRYELLRVLDLEECDNVKDEHLRKICKLLLLRYLSLGSTITMLPKDITKLKFLETLDLRRTKIRILPIQVIKLPCLTHLFGAFKLQDIGQKIAKLQDYLSAKSKLETLAGFFTDDDRGFPQLIDHMNNLTRVKVWCEATSEASTNIAHLSKAIQGFIQKGTNLNDVRSLSLHFGECFQDQEHLLNFSLEDSCYLSCLKLKGKMQRLPQFVTSLSGLTGLCLSSPHDLLNSDVLAALSEVRCLHYLKLITLHLDKFVVEQGALKSLRRLCIVVKSMTRPEIQQGALPNLESLRLLCKDLNGLCGISIQHLGAECLKEVILDERMGGETKDKWKEAVKTHPRRPRVVFLRTGEDGQILQNREAAQPADSAAALALAADIPMPVPVF
ncbi:disease resistance protein RGA4-like [Oryza brachyantha]|uniref:NB-ARC domain-containing protein n=1 Tax=Oryza brachyantha TaxID=4533 RepID=J3N889_ORYBR|nr:disease resistance protein RGA4-like [Oryza brachyantha]